ASDSRRRVSDCRGMRGEPASSFSCWRRTFPPPGGGSEGMARLSPAAARSLEEAGLARASVCRRCLGYPARTRGEVAEWLKAAPSKAPTRGRRFRGRAGFARASVFRRCLGYPARTGGEVAEWLKAAPSEAPTRGRRSIARAG